MSFLSGQRPTWATINLSHLSSNFHSVKKFVSEDIDYMAVVKANGYGHGAVDCARRLEEEGIDWFGVALPEEGLKLRENGVKSPVLCLGSFWEGQQQMLLENRLTTVIFTLEKAELFNNFALKKNTIVNIHVKIDTGMGRIGVRFDEVEKFAAEIKKFANLNVEGLMTHFAAADSRAENKFTDLQIERFHHAVGIFEKNGFKLKYKDLANSPGAIMHKNSLGNMARIGGVLYGLGNDIIPETVKKPALKPVLSLHTRISHLKRVPKGETLGYSRTYKTRKDSLIASLPIGYQDGYSRNLSNRGRVIINGTYAPIAGRISMDWTLVDVSDVPNVKIGDEAILIGEQDNLRIVAEELAEITDTISYEITCGISERVTRVYK